MKHRSLWNAFVASIMLPFLVAACAPAEMPTDVPTRAPSAAPSPTSSPMLALTYAPTSTSTPEPMHTGTPTSTNPPPTLIPTLTNTPQPTSTSMPTRTPTQLELIGHIGGTIEAMVVRGRYAYVGGEYGFSILDVSNPSQVVEVGYLALPVADLEMVGKYAYIAAKEAGLQVVDISDPLAPLMVGACVTPGEAVAIAIESGESRRRAYLSIAKKGLWMIDVSDAAKPIEIGNYKLDSWIGDVSMLSIDATQTYAYLATSDGLRVVDVSVPQSPVDVASLFKWASRVIIQGGFAYVIASDDDSTFENVHIVNVSNPVAPAVVGQYSSCVRDIALIEGAFTYIADCDGSEIVSVSDPTKPVLAASSFPDYTPCDYLVRGVLATIGNRVYAVNWQGLHIIDVSDPIAPTSAGFYSTLPGANNLVVSDEYAYIVGGESCNSQAYWGQMNVQDISNPVRPAIVETYKLS